VAASPGFHPPYQALTITGDREYDETALRNIGKEQCWDQR